MCALALAVDGCPARRWLLRVTLAGGWLLALRHLLLAACAWNALRKGRALEEIEQVWGGRVYDSMAACALRGAAWRWSPFALLALATGNQLLLVDSLLIAIWLGLAGATSARPGRRDIWIEGITTLVLVCFWPYPARWIAILAVCGWTRWRGPSRLPLVIAMLINCAETHDFWIAFTAILTAVSLQAAANAGDPILAAREGRAWEELSATPQGISELLRLHTLRPLKAASPWVALLIGWVLCMWGAMPGVLLDCGFFGQCLCGEMSRPAEMGYATTIACLLMAVAFTAPVVACRLGLALTISSHDRFQACLRALALLLALIGSWGLARWCVGGQILIAEGGVGRFQVISCSSLLSLLLLLAGLSQWAMHRGQRGPSPLFACGVVLGLVEAVWQVRYFQESSSVKFDALETVVTSLWTCSLGKGIVAGLLLSILPGQRRVNIVKGLICGFLVALPVDNYLVDLQPVRWQYSLGLAAVGAVVAGWASFSAFLQTDPVSSRDEDPNSGPGDAALCR